MFKPLVEGFHQLSAAEKALLPTEREIAIVRQQIIALDPDMTKEEVAHTFVRPCCIANPTVNCRFKISPSSSSRTSSSPTRFENCWASPRNTTTTWCSSPPTRDACPEQAATASLQNFETMGTQAFGKLEQGMGSAVESALMTKASFGQAMEEMLKKTIASIAGEATVQAIKALALGFMLLAEAHGVPTPGSSAAFTSAAIWATVAGASAVGAAALPSGAGASAGAGSAGGGGGSLTAGAPASQTSSQSGVVNVYVQGMVSSDTMDQVIAQINQRVGSGTVLKATTTTQRPTVGS